MDELLHDFLVETAEHIEAVGTQLVEFERDPSDLRILAGIYRLVHTIKGTCGFFGLPRLSYLAHAAEALIGRLRDGATATPARVSLILAAVDRVKLILAALEASPDEPEGDDSDLLSRLSSELGGEARPSDSDQPAGEPLVATGMPPSGLSHAFREPSTIRLTVDALERIMTLAAELVLARNQLVDIARHRNDDEINTPVLHLSALTTDLQDAVMHARMQPIGRLFVNLPRLVRDLAGALGKKIDLVTHGSETEIDRQLVELIRDPLTHLIRNCADHGIELPAERRRAGKPETGTISISASHEAGQLTLEIGDDGRGLDVERIRGKALTLRLASADELAKMSNDDVCHFIFAPGFSTARQVTGISGRGIGLDVVRDSVESIGGNIALATTAGAGTVFSLKIPLTLAIAPALIVEVAGSRFALPQHAVVEVVQTGSEAGIAKLESVQGALMLRLRDATIPVADLADVFGSAAPPRAASAACLIVVLHVGTVTFGVGVDAVLDVEEIIVKPLGTSLSKLALFSGNTILGDGSVVLILNAQGLASSLGLNATNRYTTIDASKTFVPQPERTNLILFRCGGRGLAAVPLSFIARIESVDVGSIVAVDGMRATQHDGRLMPLVSPCDWCLPASGTIPVLVIDVGSEPMGLAVSEIVDIVEDELHIEIAGTSPGVVGSARVAGEPIEVLDIAHFMKLARPGAFDRGHAKRFRILVVDDKQFFRDMLLPVLGAGGYQVTTAASARDALALLQRGAEFDAIVSDVDMPDIDGYTLAKLLREDASRKDLPIIALAAHAAPQVIEAARAAGMNGAIGKFDRAALLATLAGLLQDAAFNSHALESRVLEEAMA